MKSFKAIAVVMVLIFAGMFMAPRVQAEDFKGKVAYVDLGKMFDEYEKTKAYDKLLEVDNKKFQDEKTKKVDAIRELQGKTVALKDEEKAKVEKEIEKLKGELVAFDQQNRTDLTKARDEKVREILMDIEKTVSEYAKKEGLSFVFNDKMLIYGTESMNISAPVLKNLNETYLKANKK